MSDGAVLQKIVVAAFPSKAPLNEVIDNLYVSFKSNNLELVEFLSFPALMRKVDVIHIHWPEIVSYRERYVRTLLKRIWFYSVILIGKARGAKLVYTVHNINPHEPVNKSWFSSTKKFLDKSVDLYHHFYNDSVAFYEDQEHPSVGNHVVIPHPLYRVRAPSRSTESLVQSLGLDSENVVYLSVGMLRPYKRIVEIINDFRASCSRANARLIIAGQVIDESYRSAIETASEGDSRISLIIRHLSSDELSALMNLADYVVMNHDDVHNSGVAILALSHERPLIAPIMGSIVDLHSFLGDEWIKPYNASTFAQSGGAKPFGRGHDDRLAAMRPAAVSTALAASFRDLVAK